MLVKIPGWSVILLLILAAVSNYLLSRSIYEETLDEQVFNRVGLAPTDLALTLARTRGGTTLLAVGADAKGISAVDIGAAVGQTFDDSLDVYQHLGVGGLQSLYDSPTIRVAWSELGLPLAGHYPHIAVGTNYRAHADEVGLDGQPFLFPKLSRATTWNADVNLGIRLDHEVELCAVPLSSHSRDTPAPLGYLLCGDFTDRWTLVRNIEPGGKMGQTGFPAGKGGETRLPVGPLLVIPYGDDFYRQIELSLYLNDSLRQRATAGNMIWTPHEILSNILMDCQSPYTLGPEIIHIANCESIPAGTLILTGTPQGVMFHIASLWSPWAYLGEGDVVTSFGTYLGFTRNTIDRAKTE